MQQHEGNIRWKKHQGIPESTTKTNERCNTLANNGPGIRWVDLTCVCFPFQPGLLCLKAFDPAECMHRIRDNTADVAMLDSADVYMAGRYFGLVPIAAGRAGLL